MSADALLVYYSGSGKTREIARLIERVTDCDVEEIKTVLPYDNDPDKIGKSLYRPELVPFEHNIEDYGIVIIGSPVWNNDIPAPVLAFLESRDWKGVKVFPFFSTGGIFTTPYSIILNICKGASVSEPLYVIYDKNGRYVRIQE